MLLYRDGITDQAYETLQQKAFRDFGMDPQEYIIPVSKNAAENHYATNLQWIGMDIAMPYFGGDSYPPLEKTLLEKLESLGYTVHLHNMSQFIKVGGATHCTSHLVMQRVKSGLIAQGKR